MIWGVYYHYLGFGGVILKFKSRIYILGLQGRYMGTPLGPKYIPFSFMDPLGLLSIHS